MTARTLRTRFNRLVKQPPKVVRYKGKEYALERDPPHLQAALLLAENREAAPDDLVEQASKWVDAWIVNLDKLRCNGHATYDEMMRWVTIREVLKSPAG